MVGILLIVDGIQCHITSMHTDQSLELFFLRVTVVCVCVCVCVCTCTVSVLGRVALLLLLLLPPIDCCDGRDTGRSAHAHRFLLNTIFHEDYGCKRIVSESLSRGSTDNVTAVAIYLYDPATDDHKRTTKF